EDFQPFVAGLAKEDAVKNLDQISTVFAPQLHRVKAWVIDEFLNAEGVTEILPVFVLDHAEADPLLISAFVVIPQWIERVFPLVAHELMAQDRSARNVKSLQRHHRTQMRGVYLLANAIPLPRHQRHRHALGEH